LLAFAGENEDLSQLWLDSAGIPSCSLSAFPNQPDSDAEKQ